MFPNIKSAYELVQAFPTEEKCIEFLEYMRWNNFPISPYDADSKVYKCANGRYKCKNTGKYFNVKTGTMFENTKVNLNKWFFAIYLLTSNPRGITSYQLARDIGVTQKTAWFMLQRIRANFKIENGNQLGSEFELNSEIEVDESFIGGRNQFRHKDKKVPQCQGRSFKDKTPVLGMLQRGGKLTAIVIQDTKKKTIQPLIKQYVQTGSYLMTDEWFAYRGLNGDYKHKFIDHRKKEYASFGDDKSIHTNTIEGSWKILKDMYRMYVHMSKKHLQKYVDEFVYRYNLRNVSDYEKFKNLLLNSNVRTKYKDLIRCHY